MSKWWVSYIYLLFRVQAMSTYMYGLKRYAVYIISLILIIAINGHLWMAEAWIEHKSRRSTNNLNGHWWNFGTYPTQKKPNGQFRHGNQGDDRMASFQSEICVWKKKGFAFNVSNVFNFKSPQRKDNSSSEPYLCRETNGRFAKHGKCVGLLINCVSFVLTDGWRPYVEKKNLPP